ncbi:LamB/YcsF family protein [Pedobacter sp. AW1-32]|uniref:LamB/YcsF family protein n=1 Tax=Pedobacter sp. AW1-32 TaxID=3383026 RepID=UPI003FEE7963
MEHKFSIDLNCDMGESFGAYTLGNDEAMMPFITSVNIACGFHAGDGSTMRQTVQKALSYNLSIGAHPGFDDLQGFGRREMQLSATEVFDLVTYQIGALWAFTKSEGARLKHVKPHGALYNMAAKNEKLALAIASAILKIDEELIIYGLSGSKLIDAAKQLGLRYCSEVFADRTYTKDGNLTPRTEAGAMIKDELQSINQVLKMVKEGKVKSLDGLDVSIKAETICLHGDNPHAVAFAEKIHHQLKEESILLQAPK